MKNCIQFQNWIGVDLGTKIYKLNHAGMSMTAMIRIPYKKHNVYLFMINGLEDE
jgi:hypothetical protein